jgi:hypothetical protein
MKKHQLFSTWPADGFASIVCASDNDPFLKQVSVVNSVKLADSWSSYGLRWFFPKGKEKKPLVSSIFLPGVLAFRCDVVRNIFSANESNLEWLPIEIEGDSWLVLNCLRQAAGYDENESIFLRTPHEDGNPDPNGHILYINRLKLARPRDLELEVFKVFGVSHSMLFVTDKFIERYNKAGLNGLSFKPLW